MRRRLAGIDGLQDAVGADQLRPFAGIVLGEQPGGGLPVEGRVGVVAGAILEGEPLGLNLGVDRGRRLECRGFVLEGSADLGFTALIRTNEALESLPVCTAEMGVFCGAGHPLFDRDDAGITYDELCRHAFVAAEVAQEQGFSQFLRGLSIKNVPVTAGWIVAVLIVLAYAGLSLWRHTSRVRKELTHKPLLLVLLQILVLAAVVLGLTALLSSNRAPNPLIFTISGIPWVAPVVIALLLFWTFVLTRTRFGRHLYAVGGNAEAARRAGINVNRMKIAAFVICSGMAAISGILAASYTGKVSPGSGGGNELLYAVGAAVIGGTSLFGGRGRAIDAVIGGLVIATIPNGLGLLNQASYINFLVTGAVLLLAASVDAVSRRRRSSAGV